MANVQESLIPENLQTNEREISSNVDAEIINENKNEEEENQNKEQNEQKKNTEKTAKKPKWECPICQDSLRSPVITPCGHVFCRDCIDEWFKRSLSCPSCNNAIKPDQLRSIHGHGVHPTPGEEPRWQNQNNFNNTNTFRQNQGNFHFYMNGVEINLGENGGRRAIVFSFLFPILLMFLVQVILPALS